MVKIADTIESASDFPSMMAKSLNIVKEDGSEKSLQSMYEDGELGGESLPEPESKDKLLVSTENEETSELEWSQIDKGTIDGSAYVNLDVGSDLNTLITHGRFRTTTKRVDRIENVPVQVAGMLTVRLTGSVIYQTYNSIDNKMYTRTSEDAGENWSDWKDVSEGDSAFKGTHDEWNALSDEEKAMFEIVIFTDDYGERVIDDEKTSTDSTWSSKKINDSLVDIEDALDDKADKTDLSGLTFGQTDDGKWGYKPTGADTVIPFESGGGSNLKNLVPVLTGNTSWPKGAASASSVYNNSDAEFGPWKAFNESLSGTYHWWASNRSGVNQWIQYKFNTPQTVRIVQFKGAGSYLTTPKNYQIQGSNNGTTWDTLYSETGNNSNEKLIVLEDDKVKPYSYYRIYGSSWNTADGWCGLSMLRLIGDCITEDIDGNDVIMN